DDTTRIAGSYRSIALERGLELRQPVQGSFWAQVLILLDDLNLALLVFHFHRHDLFCKSAIVGSGFGTHLPQQRELVLVFAADVVLNLEVLGCFTHRSVGNGVSYIQTIPQLLVAHASSPAHTPGNVWGHR